LPFNVCLFGLIIFIVVILDYCDLVQEETTIGARLSFFNINYSYLVLYFVLFCFVFMHIVCYTISIAVK